MGTDLDTGVAFDGWIELSEVPARLSLITALMCLVDSPDQLNSDGLTNRSALQKEVRSHVF